MGQTLSLEMDAFLADPSQWPKAIFAGWDLKPGALPSNFRSWGAVKLGLEWAASRDFTFTRRQMEMHVRDHVPVLASQPDDYAVRGVETDGQTAAGHALVPTNAITYAQVYQKGLSIGYKAIEQLEQRIDDLASKGEKVPTDLLLKLADLGTKLATSQASILARGVDMNREKDEEIEGFRTGSAPLPSQRMGHSRVRVIDGESRPVHDEGPSDRHDYNERAREQGSIELPSP
jgi:hypothetical protein